MREYKFRGETLEGEIVFGGVYEAFDRCMIINFKSNNVGCSESPVFHNVNRKSVAQLVGYDINGKEIYEYDPMISEDSKFELTPYVQSMITHPNNDIEDDEFFTRACRHYKMRLKSDD